MTRTGEDALTLWGSLLSGGQPLPPSRVEIARGKITAVQPVPEPAAGDVVVRDGWIAPGLIDMQVNGAGGADLTSAADPSAALAQVARTLATHGVTAFCPTLVSSLREDILRRLPAYQPGVVEGGAECLGPHVEGPFISPDHRGVHDPAVLRDASADELNAWLAAGPPRMVTLAPERQGGLEAVQHLVKRGVLVSLGHSGADAATAQAALSLGASMGTHLFNAMPPLHHRRPGLVGALLASTATLGLIVDGVHVNPMMIDLVVRLAGTRRLAIISDALAPAGIPPGRGVLGEQIVESDGLSVRRLDGTLAGCAMLLDGSLRKLRTWLPTVPPGEIVRMLTQTPADALGLARKGRVDVGCDADLIVLDAHFNVRTTIVRGTLLDAQG
jgi:N-acetylglucosamine-6-phosphate deacetylase